MNMKQVNYILGLCLLTGNFLFAGNPDRTGESGASELLLNPIARSAGINGINSARVKGIYAFSSNIAGLAYGMKTSVGVNYTSYFTGTETNLFSAALAQEISEGNVFGICINSLNYGKVTKTTVSNPEGIGTFSPAFVNIGLSYGRLFTEDISGGIQVKMISESIDNLSATGIAFDLGLQYKTGKRDNVHFGVAVRNAGTNMSFSGDGFAFQATEPGDQGYKYTVANRSARFNMPSLITIAGAYDFYMGAAAANCYPAHRLTVAGNFIYNSFINNQYGGGLEYSFKEMFTGRVGFLYESKTFDADYMTGKTGLTAGFSYDLPLNKEKENGPTISIDYAFGLTRVFKNNHTFGLTYNMAAPNKSCKKLPKKDAYDKNAEATSSTEPAPKVSDEDRDSVILFASNIKFKTASDTLNKKGESTLNKLYEVLKKYPKANITIEAHTDNEGTPESNMALSQKRGETVKNALVEKGIKESKLKVAAFGETKPLAPNDTDEGKAQNRRVEIKIEF